MKKILKYKIDYFFVISIILFMILSILTISSSNKLLTNVNNLALKQSGWYLIGIILLIVVFIKTDFIYKHIEILYIIGNILLLGLLLFGPTINNSKCWFLIPGVGTFQPSEFMKIILIIMLAKEIDKFNTLEELKEELEKLDKRTARLNGTDCYEQCNKNMPMIVRECIWQYKQQKKAKDGE